LDLVPHIPKFFHPSVPEFLQNLLAGDIPVPLKNDSNFRLDSRKIFAKKLPPGGGFMWEKQRKKR
jgi:hypothetical protein